MGVVARKQGGRMVFASSSRGRVNEHEFVNHNNNEGDLNESLESYSYPDAFADIARGLGRRAKPPPEGRFSSPHENIEILKMQLC